MGARNPRCGRGRASCKQGMHGSNQRVLLPRKRIQSCLQGRRDEADGQHAVPCCVGAEGARHAALSRHSMRPHTENAPMTQSTVSAGVRAGQGTVQAGAGVANGCRPSHPQVHQVQPLLLGSVLS